MHVHLEKAPRLNGFAVSNVLPGQYAWVLARASLSSDHPDFYRYTEQFASVFLTKSGIRLDDINQFLVLIHEDESADIYIDEVFVSATIITTGAIEVGGEVMLSDIADVSRLTFPDLLISSTDSIVYCFRVRWRFGLFFDLSPSIKVGSGTDSESNMNQLDIDGMEVKLGDLWRFLQFYQLYKGVQAKPQFEVMMRNGWFPFVQLLPDQYSSLNDAYLSEFQIEEKVASIVESFTTERMKQITDRWWDNTYFASKRALIEAGLAAYLQKDEYGYVNSIKNLATEIEGLLRSVYLADTGRGNRVKQGDLINHIVDKVKVRGISEDSLLFQGKFLDYLKNVIFADFDVESGVVRLSRHSSSHGVADVEQYTQVKALQLILVLDQIFFYSAGESALDS
ncbi:MAG: hypothetical protein HQ478_06140 [Chloroflexi bacterium]|nr:hypothetical protein [Chloroflexota bacterium]